MALHRYSEDQKGCLSDLLIFEVDMRWSRDEVALAPGAALVPGTVLATDASTPGQLVPLPADGTPVAVLLMPVHAETTPRRGVAAARGCVLASSALVWPDGITDTQKTAAQAALVALGIVVKE